MTNNIIDCGAEPLCPEGMSIAEHHNQGRFEWDPKRVTLYLDESQENGGRISGYKLRKRFGGLYPSLLNANVLDHLLVHPDLVPDEWKDKVISFWGTIYQDSSRLGVRTLFFDPDKEEWDWAYAWLGFDWGEVFALRLES